MECNRKPLVPTTIIAVVLALGLVTSGAAQCPSAGPQHEITLVGTVEIKNCQNAIDYNIASVSPGSHLIFDNVAVGKLFTDDLTVLENVRITFREVRFNSSIRIQPGEVRGLTIESINCDVRPWRESGDDLSFRLFDFKYGTSIDGLSLTMIGTTIRGSYNETPNNGVVHMSIKQPSPLQTVKNVYVGMFDTVAKPNDSEGNINNFRLIQVDGGDDNPIENVTFEFDRLDLDIASDGRIGLSTDGFQNENSLLHIFGLFATNLSIRVTNSVLRIASKGTINAGQMVRVHTDGLELLFDNVTMSGKLRNVSKGVSFFGHSTSNSTKSNITFVNSAFDLDASPPTPSPSRGSSTVLALSGGTGSSFAGKLHRDGFITMTNVRLKATAIDVDPSYMFLFRTYNADTTNMTVVLRDVACVADPIDYGGFQALMLNAGIHTGGVFIADNVSVFYRATKLDAEYGSSAIVRGIGGAVRGSRIELRGCTLTCAANLFSQQLSLWSSLVQISANADVDDSTIELFDSRITANAAFISVIGGNGTSYKNTTVRASRLNVVGEGILGTGVLQMMYHTVINTTFEITDSNISLTSTYHVAAPFCFVKFQMQGGGVTLKSSHVELRSSRLIFFDIGIPGSTFSVKDIFEEQFGAPAVSLAALGSLFQTSSLTNVEIVVEAVTSDVVGHVAANFLWVQNDCSIEYSSIGIRNSKGTFKSLLPQALNPTGAISLVNGTRLGPESTVFVDGGSDLTFEAQMGSCMIVAVDDNAGGSEIKVADSSVRCVAHAAEASAYSTRTSTLGSTFTTSSTFMVLNGSTGSVFVSLADSQDALITALDSSINLVDRSSGGGGGQFTLFATAVPTTAVNNLQLYVRGCNVSVPDGQAALSAVRESWRGLITIRETEIFASGAPGTGPVLARVAAGTGGAVPVTLTLILRESRLHEADQFMLPLGGSTQAAIAINTSCMTRTYESGRKSELLTWQALDRSSVPIGPTSPYFQFAPIPFEDQRGRCDTFTLTPSLSKTLSESASQSPSVSESLTATDTRLCIATLATSPAGVQAEVLRRDGSLSFNITLVEQPIGVKNVVRAFAPIVEVTAPWGTLAVNEGTEEQLNVTFILPPPAEALKLFQYRRVDLHLSRESFDCPVPGGVTVSFDVYPVKKPLPQLISDQVTPFIISAVLPSTVISSPTSGLQQMRLQGVLQAGFCVFSHSEPLDRSTSPSGVYVTPPLGGYYRGTLAGGAIVCIYLSIIGVLMTTWFFDPRVPDRSLWGAMGIVHFPGIVVVPLAFLTQGAATSSVALLLHATFITDPALAVGTFLVLAIIVVGCLYKTTKALGAHVIPRVEEFKEEQELLATSPMRRFVMWLFLSDSKWVNNDGQQNTLGFKAHYQELFVNYRDGFAWFFAVEVGISVALGAAEGIRMEEHCVTVAFISFTVLFLQMLGAVVLRPFLIPYETFFHIILSCISSAASLLALLGLLLESEAIQEASGLLAIAGMVITAIKTLMDIIGLLMWFHTRYMVVLERRKKREREAEALRRAGDVEEADRILFDDEDDKAFFAAGEAVTGLIKKFRKGDNHGDDDSSAQSSGESFSQEGAPGHAVRIRREGEGRESAALVAPTFDGDSDGVSPVALRDDQSPNRKRKKKKRKDPPPAVLVFRPPVPPPKSSAQTPPAGPPPPREVTAEYHHTVTLQQLILTICRRQRNRLELAKQHNM